MKQKIVTDQYAELNEKEMEILRNWCESRGYHPASVRIGEMIEFIGNGLEITVYNDGSAGVTAIDPTWKSLSGESNLCDALWEACKEKLKNHHEPRT